jgi:predicted O-methyltransferase YrrM
VQEVLTGAYEGMAPKGSRLMATAEDYEARFCAESHRSYPRVDGFENACGYALGRERMEAAARVLACPFKKHDPCWQHGRILYAATRTRIHGIASPVNLFEVGSAKGYGALCLLWAMRDSDREGRVTSVDVIDPNERITRNTVAELDGLKTLREILEPWPESDMIDFQQSTGVDYLLKHDERIHVAFIDGKHSGPVVSQEGWLISHRQQPGDVALFDDVHLAPVERSVNELRSVYELQRFDLLPERALMLGVRK